MTTLQIKAARKQARKAWCECAMEMRVWSALDFAEVHKLIEARKTTFSGAFAN